MYTHVHPSLFIETYSSSLFIETLQLHGSYHRYTKTIFMSCDVSLWIRVFANLEYCSSTGYIMQKFNFEYINELFHTTATPDMRK